MDGRKPKPGHTEGAWGKRRGRKRRWPTRFVVVGGFIIFILVVAFLADKGWNWFNERSGSTTTTLATHVTVEVVISQGMSATAIGQVLQDKGIIDSSSSRGPTFGGRTKPDLAAHVALFPVFAILSVLVVEGDAGSSSKTAGLVVHAWQ